ncbi:MAG: hypothetical protein C4538_06310 [Nitrospiraceae bacterium]|nr:MAG: hypothetical protein C4538_06310 [Nitrospiraceae bacterium]
MTELVIQKNGFTRKTSTAYSDEFLTDSPIGQPSSGTWNILIQQIPSPILQPKRYLIALSVNREPSEVSNWSEKGNPFTQEDFLDTEEEETRRLISRIRTTWSIPFRGKLSDRLFTLLNDAKEEDPDSLGIAAGSLRYFYFFLLLHANLKCPSISLTPEYNIYASWRGEQKRVFSVHFLPNGDACFVIFKPNKSHPEKQVRFSGIATTDILMDELSPDGDLDWIFE